MFNVMGTQALVTSYPDAKFIESYLRLSDTPTALNRGIVDAVAYHCLLYLTYGIYGIVDFAGLNVWVIPPAPPPPQVSPGSYRVEGRNPNGTAYRGDLTISALSDGSYRFEWSFGSQSFRGVGTVTGDTISVDYGERYPAIYTIEDGGVLKGTWADGQGTETLLLTE